MEEFHSIDTRSTLLGRVKNPEDSESWRIFFQTYAPLVRNQARKAGLSGCEADDVAQETMIEIARRIQDFEYDRRKGSFKAWLYQLTRWRIANHFQKRRLAMDSVDLLSHDINDSDAAAPEAMMTAHPDESWEREWRQALFEAALANLRRELSPKHFQVLDCLAVKQWSTAETANLLRINRAYLYVLKCRVTFALSNEIRRLEKEPI